MSIKQESYYKTCRKLAGFTQEQAAGPLGIEVRRLSDYENGARVPDDIVERMTEAYNAPILAIIHIKANSPLGKYLPEITHMRTDNDLGFQTVLANIDADKARGHIVSALDDGELTIKDMPDIEAYMQRLDAATGKLMSAKAYISKVKNKLVQSA